MCFFKEQARLYSFAKIFLQNKIHGFVEQFFVLLVAYKCVSFLRVEMRETK